MDKLLWGMPDKNHDVKNEWKKTVESHLNFKDYIFCDTDTLKTENNYVSANLKQGRKIVLFCTDCSTKSRCCQVGK